MEKHTKNTFNSRLGFILASVGSAVGMGNIWMFPYRLGQNGGAAFLIPYFLFVALFGYVGLSGEFALGRMTGTGPVGSYDYAMKSRGLKGGKFLGAIPLIGSFGIAIGYSVIVGWVLRSIVGSLTGRISQSGAENYFAEVEQAAFNPANVVPGIGFSPDKMLQGRLFSYGDAQRYRLGVNHHLIPVNRARCPFHSYHRDGQMRVDGNYGGLTNYEPNSHGVWQENPQAAEPPLNIEGDADHWPFPCDDADYFEQPGKLFRLMTPEQQEALFGNTARAMAGVPKDIQLRHIHHCAKADPAYGAGVAKALGIPEAEI